MHPPTFFMRSNAQNTYGLLVKSDIANTVYASSADCTERIHGVHMLAETGSELVPQGGFSSF